MTPDQIVLKKPTVTLDRKPKLGDLAAGEQPCFHLLWDGTP